LSECPGEPNKFGCLGVFFARFGRRSRYLLFGRACSWSRIVWSFGVWAGLVFSRLRGFRRGQAAAAAMAGTAAASGSAAASGFPRGSVAQARLRIWRRIHVGDGRTFKRGCAPGQGVGDCSCEGAWVTGIEESSERAGWKSRSTRSRWLDGENLVGDWAGAFCFGWGRASSNSAFLRTTRARTWLRLWHETPLAPMAYRRPGSRRAQGWRQHGGGFCV